MLTKQFGVEIEFTGITRGKAMETARSFLGGVAIVTGDYYDTRQICAPDGRLWKIMYDGSITCQCRKQGEVMPADNRYSVELVTPILLYQRDIGTLQELTRRLRKAGGFTNESCGVHIHLDGADHTPRSVRNFINIIASRNDLFYKALQIPAQRARYCEKMDTYLVERMNEIKPVTFAQIEEIWYEKSPKGRNRHYHKSRYHFLNLHSFFHGNRTIELRGFNGTLHAGKLRAYIVLALALNHQALSQRSARYKKVQEENERFAMRTYLNRIGLVGDEFKSCREHLCKHLSGNAAWRYGSRENTGNNISLDSQENGGDNHEYR